MTNQTNQPMIDLLDSIQKKYPKLGHEQRVYLAAIARGYRVMVKYSSGAVGTPASMSDEWLCGNDAFAQACNAVQKIVGVNAEIAITARIRELVDEQARVA